MQLAVGGVDRLGERVVGKGLLHLNGVAGIKESVNVSRHRTQWLFRRELKNLAVFD
jgi:hypothetical protein